MKPPELISTEHLILRKPRMEAAPAVLDGWVQDADVTYFLTWLPHQNIGQTQSYSGMRSPPGTETRVFHT